jgi:Rps23 Pro-64 3,4-dihydroxylase Tpa1-like proline 4-hydroxylase
VQTSYWVTLIILVFIYAIYLSNVAGRLDRLHLKVENARNALDRQLALRTSICKEIIKLSGVDKNLIRQLEDALKESIQEEFLEVHTLQEWEIETKVSIALNNIFDDEKIVKSIVDKKLLTEIAAAIRRVSYALTFYNDAAKSAIKVRRRWTVRFFRLFGRAAMPEVISFQVQIPRGIEHF